VLRLVRTFLLGNEAAPFGDVVIHVLGLVFGVAALFAGLVYATGMGVLICFTLATLFIMAALLPRLVGRIAGGLILAIAFVVMIARPDGGVGLNAFGFLWSLPLYLVGGLFIRPDLTTMAAELFKPTR
jgi:hypothetical protein